MFCNQCGNQIPDDASFCPVCGAKKEPLAEAAKGNPEQAAAAVPNPVPAEKPAQDKKKGSLVKILIPVAIGFVAVAAVLIILLAGSGGSAKIAPVSKDFVMYGAYMDSRDCFVNLDGEVYETEHEVRDYAYNADKSVVAFSMKEGDEQNLYYMTAAMEPKLVMEDIYGFGISHTGEYIYFLQDVDNNYSGTLYLYCIKNGKIIQVDTDVYSSYICLSPSGKAISYLKDYESYDDNTLYVSGDGIKAKEVDDDGCIAVGLTDNGKTVYYLNEDYKLYVFNGKDSEKLASDVNNDIWFNKDASEIIFGKDGKTYFYTAKMDEPVKICSNNLYSISLPDSAAVSYNSYAIIVETKSLKGCVLEAYDNSLYWFNNAGTDTVRINSSTYEYQISEDGKSIVYVMSGKLYKIAKLGDKMEAELLYDDEYVDYVIASKDLSKIYVTVDEDLFYIKGVNKVEKISNDLSDDYYNYSDSVAYNDAADKIYFIENDTLMAAGKTARSAKEVADDAVFVMDMLDGVMYQIDDDGDEIYYYVGKKDPVVFEIE